MPKANSDLTLQFNANLNRKLPGMLKEIGKNFAWLAENLDMTQSSVSDARSGRNNWSLDRIVRISEIFNTPLEWLILDKVSNPKETELRKEIEELRKENTKLKKQLELFTKMQDLMKTQ